MTVKLIKILNGNNHETGDKSAIVEIDNIEVKYRFSLDVWELIQSGECDIEKVIEDKISNGDRTQIVFLDDCLN